MHTSTRLYFRIRALVALLLTLALLALPALPARAASFTVTALADSGPGSLRQAILDANVIAGADTITFGLNGTIVLASTLPPISDALTIDGTGQSITISGNNAVRVIVVNPDVTLNLNALTIADGLCSNCNGAGLYTELGTVNINHSTFSGNRTTCSPTCGTTGGGIFNVSGNVTVSNSTFAGNSAANGYGGGINNGGTLTVSNSTFSGNSASLTGGGIYNSFGSTTVSNSTFSSNSASSGSGINNRGGPGDSVRVSNSIIANSTSGTNCNGSITNGGGNISYPDQSCPALNVDPKLDPNGLQDNGGATKTIALLVGSPAIDAATSCPNTDQRGVARPQGAGCDIGAFELEAAAADTSTGLTTSANPARLDEPITFRATVTSTSGQTPDGTVTFLNGSTALGSGTLAQGVASFTTSSLPVGSSVITARYEGTARFNASVSAPTTQVVRAGSATALTLSAPTSVFGQSIVLFATVSGGTTSPSGSVTFYDGATALGTKALRSGAASLTVSTLAAGQHTLTAVYGGSPGLDGSVSPTASHTVVPAQTATTLSVVPNASTFGQVVALTANVSVAAPGGGNPAGTVSFYDGATLLGTKTVANKGVATFSTGALAVGSHSLRAEYGGSANHSASASAVATLVVATAGTSTTLATSATDAVNGQKVTLTASVGVVAPGKGTPTGSILFRDGATELGSVALSNGRASKVVTLALGSHSLTAEYVPANDSFSASSGAASVNVGPASTSVTLTTSGTPSTYGSKVTFTATVKVSAPGAGTPTGTVAFRDGEMVLAQVALVNGKASYATAALASGAHQITATYSGDAGNTGSVSSTLTQQVN